MLSAEEVQAAHKDHLLAQFDLMVNLSGWECQTEWSERAEIIKVRIAELEKELAGYREAMRGAVCGQCCDNIREIIAGRKSLCPGCSGLGYILLDSDDEPDPEWLRKGRGYTPQCTTCAGMGMINTQAREGETND